MNFVNHTPFPAQAFEGIDWERRSFHVVVLRQTLSFAEGELTYADTQAPLCDADIPLTKGTSWRQESDLCHFKPHCDVIANATAYAPQGKPCAQFVARLTIRRPDTPAPLPLRPQGLNQFEEAAPEIMARWRAQVKHAERYCIPGMPLIDKSLCIIGPRQFIRKRLFIRTLHWIVRLGTLGMLRPTSWKLTRPEALTTLTLNDRYAFGGECRIDAGDPAAERLPARRRIPASALAAHPEHGMASDKQPVLHMLWRDNPQGMGFVDWNYLRATKIRRVAAPQIEHIDAKLNARLFGRMLYGRLNDGSKADQAPFELASFGILAKSHPARHKLAGTIDQAFIDGSDALPKDFDFAFWNAAPTDQQTPFLRNDEMIELVNLCVPGTPGAAMNANGNTTLRLSLLQHECFALCRRTNGTIFRQVLMIDTLVVEPDARAVTLVWRAVIEKNPDFPLRTCEARMHSHQERDHLTRDCAAIADLLAVTPSLTDATAGAKR